MKQQYSKPKLIPYGAVASITGADAADNPSDFLYFSVNPIDGVGLTGSRNACTFGTGTPNPNDPCAV